MLICCVICENGLGHFKRMTGWVNYLLQRHPGLQFHLICRTWQIQAVGELEQGAMFRNNDRVSYSELPSPGVIWSRDPDIFSDGRLIKWTETLKCFSPLTDADIVISDNLSGILDIRPDTVLMGSFLWMDVMRIYDYIPAVQEYIAYETALLERYRPFMISVGAIAMPSVKKYTRYAGMPWFGTDIKSPPKPKRERESIALIGGATPSADRLLLDTATALLEKTPYRIMVAERFYEKAATGFSDRCDIFSFSHSSFEAADLVICRAGAGTLTDCITTNTPMLLLPESDNAEMEYNAACIESLGVGRRLKSGFSADELISAITHTFDEIQYQLMTEALLQQSVQGFEKATDWLFTQYSIH